jgi:GNAT superfamily N-acetyltransferase
VAAPQLRDATARDADACAGLLAELGYPCAASEASTRLAALRGDPAQHLRVAVDASGRVLGLAHAGIRCSLELGRHAELLTLVVTADARGQGVGSLLLADCERWARGVGLPLWLRSRIARSDAHAFYARRGWQRIKTQHVFRHAPAGTSGAGMPEA